MHEDIDLAPFPDEILTIKRAPTGYGWSIHFDNEQQACFSSCADMCEWLKGALRFMDIEAGVIPRSEPMKPIPDSELPRLLQEAQLEAKQKLEPKQRGMFRIFAGGKG